MLEVYLQLRRMLLAESTAKGQREDRTGSPSATQTLRQLDSSARVQMRVRLSACVSPCLPNIVSIEIHNSSHRRETHSCMCSWVYEAQCLCAIGQVFGRL